MGKIEPLMVNSDMVFSVEKAKLFGPRTMKVEHFHNYYEIYYLFSGKRFIFLNDRTYLLNKGDMVFIPQNCIHKTIDAGGIEHERSLINFTYDFISGENKLFQPISNILSSEGRVLSLNLREQSFIDNKLQEMLIEKKENQLGQDLYFKTLLIQILLFLYRNKKFSTQEQFKYLSPMHKKVSEIVHYINEHYAESILLSDLSKLFFVSPFYICRTFKEATGFSFSEYLTNIRIKEAKKLLKETDLKVIKIAETCGFGSLSNFGRIFKASTGTSPLHYRKGKE